MAFQRSKAYGINKSKLTLKPKVNPKVTGSDKSQMINIDEKSKIASQTILYKEQGVGDLGVKVLNVGQGQVATEAKVTIGQHGDHEEMQGVLEETARPLVDKENVAENEPKPGITVSSKPMDSNATHSVKMAFVAKGETMGSESVTKSTTQETVESVTENLIVKPSLVSGDIKLTELEPSSTELDINSTEPVSAVVCPVPISTTMPVSMEIGQENATGGSFDERESPTVARKTVVLSQTPSSLLGPKGSWDNYAMRARQFDYSSELKNSATTITSDTVEMKSSSSAVLSHSTKLHGTAVIIQNIDSNHRGTDDVTTVANNSSVTSYEKRDLLQEKPEIEMKETGGETKSGAMEEFATTDENQTENTGQSDFELSGNTGSTQFSLDPLVARVQHFDFKSLLGSKDLRSNLQNSAINSNTDTNSEQNLNSTKSQEVHPDCSPNMELCENGAEYSGSGGGASMGVLDPLFRVQRLDLAELLGDRTVEQVAEVDENLSLSREVERYLEKVREPLRIDSKTYKIEPADRGSPGELK